MVTFDVYRREPSCERRLSFTKILQALHSKVAKYYLWTHRWSEDMKTPKTYNDNLKRGIVTEQMMDDALYSVNKRAKNWRDKKREYRNYRYDIYHNEEKAEAEEEKMYKMKETLLKYLEPVCVQKEFAGYETERIYSTDDDFLYLEKYEEYRKKGLITHTGEYYSKEDYGWVYFFDYKTDVERESRYYLYYECGEHSFHTPITKDEAEKSGKEIIEMDSLYTKGVAYTDLLSVQFVTKMIGALESGAATVNLDSE